MILARHPALPNLAASVALSLAAIAPQAGAAPLNTAFGGNPYADTALSGTTLAARPELAGTVLTDLDQAFTVGAVSGVVQSRVVRETASGTLDFYWRVIIDPSSPGGVTALRLADFGYGSLTDADYRIDGPGTDTVATARLFNPAMRPAGDINFLFAAPLAGDESSSFFFLHTNATDYAQSAIYDVVDASDNLSTVFDTFAPAVPEPAPAALLGLGLLTLLWRRRGVPRG